MKTLQKLALGLAAMAQALPSIASAQDLPKPKPGQVLGADISDDQAIDCMLRMVRLSNAARKLMEDPKTSASDRKEYQTVDDQASRGVSFYVGIIYTRPWINDRQAALHKSADMQAKESDKETGERSALCLNRAMQAQGWVFDAATGEFK